MHWKGKAEYNFYRSLEKRQQISLDYLRNLVIAIGERTAIVDACVSPRLVTELRSLGLDAIWVPAVLGDGVSDEEIQRLLLSKGQRVLLTQDVKFFRKMGQDAILLHRFKEKFWGRMGNENKRIHKNGHPAEEVFFRIRTVTPYVDAVEDRRIEFLEKELVQDKKN